MRPLIRRKHWSRVGVTATSAIALLVVLIAALVVLDERDAEQSAAELEGYIRERAVEPSGLVASAVQSHRIVFVGDLLTSAVPERIAADAIEAAARRTGLDAILLDVDASQQPVIDRYLATQPEDASLLLANPRALKAYGENAEPSSAYLELYRRIWAINRELGADRWIRIVAADLPDWPPVGAASPRRVADLFGRRGEYMVERLRQEVLERDPDARILAFVDGFQVLKNVELVLDAGGGEPVIAVPLATRAQRLLPGEVYSVLTDAPAGARGLNSVPGFAGTEVFDVLRQSRPGEIETPFAVPAGPALDRFRDPVREAAGPGIDLDIRPEDYRLTDVIDAYVFADR